jgi:RHS repeat-associated protein
MVDERLPGGASYNPVYDVQGDVIGLLNGSGELVQTVRYGPYGENATAGGSLSYSATNDPFMFQGGYHLAGGNAGEGNVPNDLYHFGERYYDPTSGRWTQQDPDGAVDSYGFAEDDPVNNTDPEGTCVFDRDVAPPVFSQGKYTYIELCGVRGKSAGKRVGYLRVTTAQYAQATRGGLSIFGRVVEGVVGGAAVVGGVLGGAVCVDVTIEEAPEVAAHCVLSSGSIVLAGGAVVADAIKG